MYLVCQTKIFIEGGMQAKAGIYYDLDGTSIILNPTQ